MNYAMSQRHTRNTSKIKRILLNPHVRVIIPQGEDVAEKVFLSKYEMSRKLPSKCGHLLPKAISSKCHNCGMIVAVKGIIIF